MVDFSGAYFANLSLLEQINVICYLNSNWQLKGSRRDRTKILENQKDVV
jgi:hypothetical protein